MIKLFLSPAGRMTRQQFWIGIAGYALFVFASKFLLGQTVGTMAGFFLFLIYIVLIFQIMYSVYGKRLHDMGRSFWPLTGMLTLTVLLMIFVMLAFGGAEYISAFSQYERKAEIDEATRTAIIETYQAEMANAEAYLGPMIYGIWAAFTLWVGLSKPDPEANRYGPPLTNGAA